MESRHLVESRHCCLMDASSRRLQLLLDFPIFYILFIFEARSGSNITNDDRGDYLKGKKVLSLDFRAELKAAILTNEHKIRWASL